MAKSFEKLRARVLRRQGRSIRDIAKSLKVSKASASFWCRDISLSKKQIAFLHENQIRGGYVGRLKGALLQKTRKSNTIKEYRRRGIEESKNIGTKELMFVGLGLFLGEGSKAESRVRFSNSDPKIMKLILRWFIGCFNVKFEDFVFRIHINELHRMREGEILERWRSVTGATQHQFRKSVFIKTLHKKHYENENGYIGTATMVIARSTDLQYRILGLCYGILNRFELFKPR